MLTDEEIADIIRRKHYDARNAVRRARYATDAEYRARALSVRLLYRDASNVNRRSRYATDEQFRTACINRTKNWRMRARHSGVSAPIASIES